MKKLIFLAASAILLLSVNSILKAQLTANAGADKTVCDGFGVTIGGSPSASGGTSPYTYSWTPSTGLSNATDANPNANPTTTTTYILEVTDAALNTDKDTVLVTVTPPPIASAGSDVTICAGTAATLTASGGTTYLWPTGSTNASITVTPAATTTYTVTVSVGSCTATDDVTVIVNPPPVANAGQDVTICLGSCVTLTATGGMSYTWSTGGSNPNFVVCPSVTTTYTVTVTDASGCWATDQVTVFVAGPTNVTASSINPSCGLCNGSVTLNAYGGTPPYTYMWSNGQNGQASTTMCPGTYTVTITDALGCSSSSSVTLVETQGVNVVLDTLINANCSNNTLGSITVHGECGTAPYSYNWSNGQADSVLNYVGSGTYTVTITDELDSTSSASYTVSSTPNIYASITTTQANCSDNGTATLNVQGTYPPFEYEWSDALNQISATATGLSQGTYYVTVTDSIGCSLVASTYMFSSCMNVIRGRVYLDTNQNCVQDPGEPGIANKMLYASPGYYYANTDANGDYTIMTTNLNNTLNAPYMQAPYALTCPSSGTYSVNFGQLGDTLSGYDFAYFTDPDYFDLSVNMSGLNARPGFVKKEWIYYHNNSLNSQNVIVRFTYDSLLQYDSCHQGGVHYPMQHMIEWTINNVPAGNYWYSSCLEAFLYTPLTIPVGTSINSCVQILPVTGDANPANNTYCRQQIVTNSCDPNSKDVSPVGLTEEGYITADDSTLSYTIHFQNTGTDTAFTVIVVDTLSPYLNPASVIPGAASHPYSFSLSGQGIITFRFDNILLPDSNVNEPASNGYVSFSVNQKPGNPEGTVMLNTAWNYFDFNLPVATNTAKNTIGTPEGIAENVLNYEGLNIFPNPFRNEFTIELTGVATYPCSIKIYNSLAELLMTKDISMPVISVSGINFKNGMYYIIVEDRNGNVVGKGKIVSNQ